MNTARIVRDNENNVYLEVKGEPLGGAIYFKIEEFTTELIGKIINLSDNFLINLKGEKR